MKYWLNKANRTEQEVVSKGEHPLHGDENGKMDRYGFYAVEITEADYRRLQNLPADTDNEKEILKMRKKYLVEQVKYADDSREIVHSWVQMESDNKGEAIAKANTLTSPGYGGLVSVEDEHGALEAEYEITHEEIMLSKEYESVYNDNGTFYGTDAEPYINDDGSQIMVKAYNIDENPYMLTFNPNPDYLPGIDAPEHWSNWIPTSAEAIDLG